MKEDDEWKTVSSSDKKRVMRKRRGKHATRGSSSLHSVDEILSRSNDYLEESDRFLACLKTAQVYLNQSDFWKSFKDLLSRCSIQQVMCYGLGNFSKTSTTCIEAPMWQLAFLCCIKEELLMDSFSLIECYDPVMTSDERSFLKAQLLMEPLSVNEKGLRKCNRHTLFFMPHCPWTLYENVVYSNWTNKDAILVIGNSLSDVCDAHTCPCLDVLSNRLSQQALVVSKSDLKGAPGNLLGAFNDTYLSHWNCSLDNDNWPARPYDQPLPVDDPELL